MYNERLRFALNHNTASYLLLLFLFWLIRLLEFLQTHLQHPTDALTLNTMGLALAWDTWTVLILSAIGLPFYIGSYLLVGPFTRYFMGFWFWLLAMIYILLVGYYTETSVPLGADLWGYSLNDIQTTVSASAQLGIAQVLPFVIVTALLLYFYKRFQEYIFPNYALVGFYAFNVLALTTWIFTPPSPASFENDNAYIVSVNKLDYFGTKSFKWWYEQQGSSDPNAYAEYPFMHDADTADVLSPFFDSLPGKPNIVVIIVEGLGGTFVGQHAQNGGCTPFLDSLAAHSLFWENTLSNSGRTFGVLPSLLGSLPPGKHGFMEEGSAMPAHHTLFTQLKANGYSTRYFYGGNINFDKQDVFLERQGVDFILNEKKFPADYIKLAPNSQGFSWGYTDGEVFRYMLNTFPADTTSAALSVFMTLSTHEPFKVPGQEQFLPQLEAVAAARPGNTAYNNYKAEFSTILYTDNAIRNFMNAYRMRADYANTIFIITGDHRMIPIPQINRLDRFHVPLILFSPRLKRTQTFEAINTHQDLVPTLLPFLANQAHLRFISRVHWLGTPLDTTHGFNSTKQAAFMVTKNELQDFINGPYFYTNNVAYRISPQLELLPTNDARLRSTLSYSLDSFKEANNYAIENNKVYNKPIPTSEQFPVFSFTRQELFRLRFMKIDSMNPEEMFAAARIRLAHDQYENARLICQKALLESPNYTDMRLLYANSYAWKQDYVKARSEFKICVKRESNNPEAWQYYIQNEIWSGAYDTAMILADSAYHQFNNRIFQEQKQKAYALKYGK